MPISPLPDPRVDAPPAMSARSTAVLPPGYAIRPATLADIPAILQTVRGFAREELMLPIAFGDAIERLRDFLLLEDVQSAHVVGTVAVHVSWDDLVELRTLAVETPSQGRGFGRALAAAAKAEARRLRASRMFTLSYVPEFFRKLGFEEVERSSLPHKIWVDCIKCPKFPDCGETALAINL